MRPDIFSIAFLTCILMLALVNVASYANRTCDARGGKWEWHGLIPLCEKR
jgi:hypothetical protein